jgi:hypothetical protein
VLDRMLDRMFVHFLGSKILRVLSFSLLKSRLINRNWNIQMSSSEFSLFKNLTCRVQALALVLQILSYIINDHHHSPTQNLDIPQKMLLFLRS